jgi:hypothetical protein
MKTYGEKRTWFKLSDLRPTLEERIAFLRKSCLCMRVSDDSSS